MGLIIFLRKRTYNHFREVVLKSLDCGAGNKAVMSSGFYQENFRGSPYTVSTEGNLDQILLRNKIELTTIGVHNWYWLRAYKNFRDNLVMKGVNIIAKRVYRLHWHAKIFILKKDDLPILGIIGSSNMTRNAFGITHPFNYEADVIMWLDDAEKLNNIMSEIINEQGQFSNEIIVTDYDPDKNFGQTIEQRLRQLDNDIKEIEQTDLEE